MKRKGMIGRIMKSRFHKMTQISFLNLCILYLSSRFFFFDFANFNQVYSFLLISPNLYGNID